MPQAPKGLWTGTFDSDNIAFEISSEGILAAINLWKATGDRQYEEKAAQLSQVILQRSSAGVQTGISYDGLLL